MYNPEDDINLLDTQNESLNPDVDSSEAKLAKLIKQKQMLDLINSKVNMPNLNVESNNQQVNNSVPELNQTQLQDLQSSYLDPREYLASVGSKLPVRKDEAPLDKPTGPIVPKDKSIVQKDTKQLSDALPTILPTDTYSNKLAELQDRANRMASLMDLGRAMSAASATMVGAKESAIDRPLQAMKESIEATPRQFIELKEQEKNDPNSPSSKQARAIYKQITGEDAPSNVSSADLEKQNPIIASMMKKREEIASREFIAGENAKQRAHALEMLKLEREEKAKQNIALKDEQTMMKINEKWMSPSMGSSRSNAARNQAIINASQKIDALIKSQKNPNDLTNRDVYEIAKSLDAMLSIGAPTISGTKELKPQTIISRLSGLGEEALNRPVGAGLGDFIKRTAHLIERERKIAQNQLNAVHQQLLEGIPETYKQRNPEEMKKLTQRLFENQMKADYPEQSLGIESTYSSKQNSQEVGKLSGLTPEQRRKRIEELKSKLGQ